jgi:hypothetical protein
LGGSSKLPFEFAVLKFEFWCLALSWILYWQFLALIEGINSINYICLLLISSRYIFKYIIVETYVKHFTHSQADPWAWKQLLTYLYTYQ